jgi:hypothetical protein
MNFVVMECPCVFDTWLTVLCHPLTMALSVLKVSLINVPAFKAKKPSRPIGKIVLIPALCKLTTFEGELPALSMPGLPMISPR